MHLRLRSIRLRLTLIYGGVFLVSATALLTIGYLLVRHNLGHHHFHDFAASGAGAGKAATGRAPTGTATKPPTGQSQHLRAEFEAAYRDATTAAVHKLLLEYVSALIVMTAVSVALGWWMAGRALAPLRAITAAARRVSGENLGERIKLKRADDELKELADTFDGMLARLDAAFASQQHFVANASHELRTPLAIMRTEVDVALADPAASRDDLRAMGEAVRETIDRSEALIAALLFLARSEGLHGHEEPVDLAEVASACMTDLTRSATAAEITIEADLGRAVAHGDRALLERTVMNLIENAIRHNLRGGHIRVCTAAREGSAEVLVENDGRQIDPDQVGTLTEPFRRLSRTAGGFGLGLSIVRSVAEVHGGSVHLHARPEGGLSARVRIPLEAVVPDRQPVGGRQARVSGR